MRMTPDQFLGHIPNNIVDVKLAGFARDLGVQHDEKEKIAQFFAKIRVVVRPHRPGHFVSFFNQSRQERLMRLLAVPWTTTGGAQLRDDFAQLLKPGHSVRSAAQSNGNPVVLPSGFATGFLDFARNDISKPPERTVGAELGNFAGRFFADVNRNPDHANERADEDERHQPGRNVTNAQRSIKSGHAVHGHRGVQKDFRHPRDKDEDENKNVIAFQAAADRFQLADFEAGQNQIFADELLPFALEQVAVLHHHWNKEMRFEHANARAKRVIKAIAPGFDPKHHPDNREVEKENDVRHL